jgi:gas vesicle protein
MRHKEFWLAMGMGALVGAVATIFATPQSGVSARKKLSHKMKEAGKSLDETAGDLANQAERLVEKGRKQMKPAMDAASDFAETLAGDVRKRAQNLM